MKRAKRMADCKKNISDSKDFFEKEKYAQSKIERSFKYFKSDAYIDYKERLDFNKQYEIY